MPVTVECESCQQRFKANDKLAGRTVKCPRCGGAIQVALAVDAAIHAPTG